MYTSIDDSVWASRHSAYLILDFQAAVAGIPHMCGSASVYKY